MSQQNPIRLIPRNAAALRRGQTQENAAKLVTGNPASTRLESGVGNCFPGLECDMRNLERRFFPFLEIDVRETKTPSRISFPSMRPAFRQQSRQDS
jgi:hypothetical protein